MANAEVKAVSMMLRRIGCSSINEAWIRRSVTRVKSNRWANALIIPAPRGIMSPPRSNGWVTTLASKSPDLPQDSCRRAVDRPTTQVGRLGRRGQGHSSMSGSMSVPPLVRESETRLSAC